MTEIKIKKTYSPFGGMGDDEVTYRGNRETAYDMIEIMARMLYTLGYAESSIHDAICQYVEEYELGESVVEED